ncbi:MAG: YceI family protein [Bacteroidota bacterium]
MKILTRVLFFFAIAGLMTACKGPKGEKATTTDEVKTETKKVDNAAVEAYTVNAGGTLNWEGSKVIGGGHQGTINISSGALKMEGGKVTGGKFEVDMASINCTDLEGDMKGNLEGHLKNADFFDIENHPTSAFEITNVQALDGDAEANSIVSGNLTIKGKTKNITFKAKIDAADGSVKVSSPQFVIDRTDWDVQYGSTKFFSDLAKDKVISDKIGLSVNFSAAKKVEG